MDHGTGRPAASGRRSLPERIPELFEVLGAYGAAALDLVDLIERPADPAGRLVVEITDHAFTALQGGVVLLRFGHWQLAAGPVRQLFELCLDVEQLLAATDPVLAAQRYRRFGALQEVRRGIAEARLAVAEGRSDESLTDFEQNAIKVFAEFRIKRRGQDWWAETWTGKTTKQVAEASQHPLRRYEYEIIFRELSAYSHGAPMTVSNLHDRILTDGSADAVQARRDTQAVEMVAHLTTFFGSVWREGQRYLPPLSPALVKAQREILRLRETSTSPADD